MNRAFVVALYATIILVYGATTVTVAQEINPQEMELAPVLDGTHMDDMLVDPMASVESVVQMDSASRLALDALSQEVSEGVMGYRVGLFFDNSSSARAKAQEAVALCDSLYGDVITTLSYANPYFKVSAGYCVTLEEALMLLNRMQRSFPKAFLISERIMPNHLVEVREWELRDKLKESMLDELQTIDSLIIEAEAETIIEAEEPQPSSTQQPVE